MMGFFNYVKMKSLSQILQDYSVQLKMNFFKDFTNFKWTAIFKEHLSVIVSDFIYNRWKAPCLK